MEFVSDKTVFRYFIFYMKFVADKMFFDFHWLGNYNNFQTTSTVLIVNNWIVLLISAYYVVSDAADAIKFYKWRMFLKNRISLFYLLS